MFCFSVFCFHSVPLICSVEAALMFVPLRDLLPSQRNHIAGVLHFTDFNVSEINTRWQTALLASPLWWASTNTSTTALTYAAVHGQTSRGQQSAFRPSSGLSSIKQERDGELTWNHQEEKRSIFVLTLWQMKWNKRCRKEQAGEKGKVKKSWAENGAAEENLHTNLRQQRWQQRMKSDEMFKAARQRRQLRASRFAPAAERRRFAESRTTAGP